MTAIKYILPKDAAELNKMCEQAVKSVQTARTRIQQAAIGVLHHAYKHGDYSAANTLVQGLGNTINGKALVEFFVRFGGLTINAEGKAFDSWKGKQHIEDNFTEAKATMWWDLKQQQAFKGFDIEAALQRIIKQHKETQEKIVGLTPEDQAKVNLKVSDATMQQLFALVEFEPIVLNAGKEQEQAA